MIATKRFVHVCLPWTLGLLVACNSDPRATSECTPGTAVACACTVAVGGTMTCGSDGAYGACDCSSTGNDLGVDVDMGAALDATMDAPVTMPLDAATDGRIFRHDLSLIDAGLVPCLTVTDCNDDNTCTNDMCIAGHCTYTERTGTCDDARYCTELDACEGGSCVGGALVVCGVGCVCDEVANACVTDSAADLPDRPACLVPASM